MPAIATNEDSDVKRAKRVLRAAHAFTALGVVLVLLTPLGILFPPLFIVFSILGLASLVVAVALEKVSTSIANPTYILQLPLENSLATNLPVLRPSSHAQRIMNLTQDVLVTEAVLPDATEAAEAKPREIVYGQPVQNLAGTTCYGRMFVCADDVSEVRPQVQTPADEPNFLKRLDW